MSHGEVTELAAQIALEKQQAERERREWRKMEFLLTWWFGNFYIFLCVSGGVSSVFSYSAFAVDVFAR